MKKSSSHKQLSVPKSKQLYPVSPFERHIRSKLNPVLKIYNKEPDRKMKKPVKKSQQQIYVRSFITSPNSYQNSELISKKQSREKKKLFKKKKSNPKIKDKHTFIKKENEKVLSSKKQNINLFNSKPVLSLVKTHQKNTQSTTPNLRKYLIHDWQNTLLKNILSIPENRHSHHRLEKIDELIDKLRSVEEQSSSSSINFLKFVFGQQARTQQAILVGKPRILIIDWLFLISASLLINRETVHLAVHYMDGYLQAVGNLIEQMHILAAASLLLSVKQQEREKQADFIDAICLSQKISIQKKQIVQKEQEIVIKLNFRLKSHTISFWVDYFSTKWDRDIERKEKNCMSDLKLRSSEGDSYRYYKQLTQLSDALLFFSEYLNFNKAKLALAILYLVLRIQFQDRNQPIMNKDKENISMNIHTRTGDQSMKSSAQNHVCEQDNTFVIFKRQFMQKATPIFKDPLNFNQTFNNYLTQLCSFQLTQIIPAIKFVSNFLDYKFSYQIDEKSFEESDSYEQFIRKMTYSLGMKQYANEQIIR